MKRLIILIVGAALLVHFLLFAMSAWPYQKLYPVTTSINSAGQIVKVESEENKEIIKSNVQKYIIINVVIMVAGVSSNIWIRKKPRFR